MHKELSSLGEQPSREAIERKLTLREAINQGLINGDAPFGFMDYDPGSLYRGYSYRSILILRAHQIVPAGWELAALAIDKYEGGKVKSLNDLIGAYVLIKVHTKTLIFEYKFYYPKTKAY